MQSQGFHRGLLPQKANGKEPSRLTHLLVATHAPWVATVAPVSASVYTELLCVVSACASQDVL